MFTVTVFVRTLPLILLTSTQCVPTSKGNLDASGWLPVADTVRDSQWTCNVVFLLDMGACVHVDTERFEGHSQTRPLHAP